MVLRFYDGRLHKIALPAQYLPPAEDFSSRLFNLFNRLSIGLDRISIDQRTQEDAWLQWITDVYLFVCRDQLRDHFIVTRLVDEEPPGRRATLAGGADRAEQDGANRQGEIRRLIHDDGIVPAQLQERPPQPLRDGRGHRSTDRNRPSERDQWESGILNQGLRDGLLTRDDQ